MPVCRPRHIPPVPTFETPDWHLKSQTNPIIAHLWNALVAPEVPDIPHHCPPLKRLIGACRRRLVLMPGSAHSLCTTQSRRSCPTREFAPAYVYSLDYGIYSIYTYNFEHGNLREIKFRYWMCGKPEKLNTSQGRARKCTKTHHLTTITS